MPTTYFGRPILTEEEFLAEKAQGEFNPQATYASYMRMVETQRQIVLEARAEADREGYELGAPQMELTEEDEAILDRVYAEARRQKEQERLAA
jgi:hypothetical protein